LNILYISYYVIYILYYVLYISYYVFDEYSLVLVLNRMSKRLKGVTNKLFGGKGSRALPTDTLFQGCSTAGTRWAGMMRHMDPSLVGSSTRSHRDEVTFHFHTIFLIWNYWPLYISFFQEENNLRREEEVEDTSDGGQDSEEEEEEKKPEQEEEKERHEEEGHYEGEDRHYEDEVVGVTHLL
jgi:hypothetical protein